MKTKYIKPVSTIYELYISGHILAGSGGPNSISNEVNLGNGGNVTAGTTADSRNSSFFDDDDE